MKVDINLMNATVQDILDFLTEQDGLNVIADEGISTTDTITVRLKQVELRKVLDFIQSNMSLEFHIDDNVLWVTQSDEEEVLGPGLETRVLKLRKGYIVSDAGGSAGGGDIDDAGGFSSGGGESSQAEGGESQNHGSDELYDILNLFFGEEASQEQPEGAFFKLYRNRNTLVIHNTKRNIRKAMELINAFDVDPLQVNIETKIISMTMQDLFSLGTEIQRLQNDRNDNPQFSGSTAFGFLNNPTSTFSFGGVIDDLQYEFLFSAVQELDSAQELSQPSMTVVNNHTAKLQRGQVLTYFDEFDTENSGGENPVQTIVPSGEAQELELGLNYNVRPSVGNDQETITMAVNLSFRTFLGFDTYGGTAPDDDDDTDPEPIDDNDNPNGLLEGEGSVVQVPRYDENAISTIANVLSGQTIVLGGQYDSSIQEVESKVPFLGDLPIIGFLFKKVERIDEPKHLLIFIKATIVDPDGKFVFPDMEE